MKTLTEAYKLVIDPKSPMALPNAKVWTEAIFNEPTIIKALADQCPSLLQIVSEGIMSPDFDTAADVAFRDTLAHVTTIFQFGLMVGIEMEKPNLESEPNQLEYQCGEDCGCTHYSQRLF